MKTTYRWTYRTEDKQKTISILAESRKEASQKLSASGALYPLLLPDQAVFLIKVEEEWVPNPYPYNSYAAKA
jgi:hypothetical protein